MRCHVISKDNNSFQVHSSSDLASQTVIGEIYPGEVYTLLENPAPAIPQHVNYIGFLNSKGVYSYGFAYHADDGGNLAFHGAPDNLKGVSCYRLKLRSPLQVVSTKGTFQDVLTPGDYVYTTSADAGQSNCQNMYIIGYKKKNEAARVYEGFVMLDYTVGSMFATNFCLMWG